MSELSTSFISSASNTPNDFISKKTDFPIKIEVDYLSNYTKILEEKIEKCKININNKNYNQGKCLYYDNVPEISIYDYLLRINEYIEINESILASSLFYINKLIINKILLTMNNIHKIILISIALSLKYNNDLINSNVYYSEVGGLSVQEFNEVEFEFLKLIHFNCYIKQDEFEDFINLLKDM